MKEIVFVCLFLTPALELSTEFCPDLKKKLGLPFAGDCVSFLWQIL